MTDHQGVPVGTMSTGVLTIATIEAARVAIDSEILGVDTELSRHEASIGDLRETMTRLTNRRYLLLHALEGLRALKEAGVALEAEVTIVAATGPSGPAVAPIAVPVSAPEAQPPVLVGHRADDRLGPGIDEERLLEVIGALQPIGPGELAERLGMTAVSLRERLDLLEQRGLVRRQGERRARRVELVAAPPARVPAKATVPSPPTYARAQSTDDSVHAAVAARDAAMLERLGKGDATFDELLAAMPPEPWDPPSAKSVACKQALRRLHLKGLIVDLGTKFRSAK